MHTICTFVLRLLVDTVEPEMLRGALQPMPDAAALPFVGEEALLALLHQVTWQAAQSSRPEAAAKSATKDGEENGR